MSAGDGDRSPVVGGARDGAHFEAIASDEEAEEQARFSRAAATPEEQMLAGARLGAGFPLSPAVFVERQRNESRLVDAPCRGLGGRE